MKPAIKNIFRSIFILAFIFSFYIATCPGENMPAQKNEAAPGGIGALNKREILARAATLAVPFVENAGQFAADVKYSADLFAGRFFLTDEELVYLLPMPAQKNGPQPDKRGKNVKHEANASGKGLVFREFFADQKGGKIGFMPKGVEKTETRVSYFKGSNADKWRVNISSYLSVSLGWVFPGVEIKLKASGRNVEKIFFVSPRGNVAGIKIGVAGVDGLKLAEDGRLMLKNSLGELAMRAPVAWQEIGSKRREVKVGYRLLGGQFYGFSVMGKYDKESPLIIDPELDTFVASTFLGEYFLNTGNSVVLDISGNVYVTGRVFSETFPVMPDAYDNTYNGGVDAFVAKLDKDLTTVLASTYLGGSDFDSGFSLALDSSGNVFLSGITRSTDFPTSQGAYDREYNSSNNYSFTQGDLFVAKLSSGLTTLLASSYLGGSDRDGIYMSLYNYSSENSGGNSLALDALDNVYLIGFTNSADFPTTPEAYDQDSSKRFHLFISKLDGSLTTLLASTFLGGHSIDYGNSLALDSFGNVYVAGDTDSDDFPTSEGAYDRIYNGGNHDVFISKLNSSLSVLLASTYLGGNKSDFCHSLALDGSGSVYLTGYTHSAADFPVTAGAYDQTLNGDHDVFVSKLNNDLSALLASTYLGGRDKDEGISLTLDIFGNVYLCGVTGSSDFPVTPGAYDQNFNGYTDVFISKLDCSLTTLLASTYLGGWYVEKAYSLTLDSLGNVFVTGETLSKDFPITAGSYNRNFYYYSNSFISKLGSFLILSAERRDARAFSMVRQYCQIQIKGGVPSIPVTQYLVFRRQGSGDFELIRTIDPSELYDNQFQMQDKYLEKDMLYTYRVEAYDAAGKLLGGDEKTI